MTALFRTPLTRKRRKGDEGFTLIELLVVVVIIGVLIAIAVPLYSNYKKGAQNTSASSDVRNAVTAVEQFYTSNGNKYPAEDMTTAGTTANAGKQITLKLGASQTTDKISVSTGNILWLRTVPADPAKGYVICAQNTNGKSLYVYKSTGNPPSVAKVGTAAISTTNCPVPL